MMGSPNPCESILALGSEMLPEEALKIIKSSTHTRLETVAKNFQQELACGKYVTRCNDQIVLAALCKDFKNFDENAGAFLGDILKEIKAAGIAGFISDCQKNNEDPLLKIAYSALSLSYRNDPSNERPLSALLNKTGLSVYFAPLIKKLDNWTKSFEQSSGASSLYDNHSTETSMDILLNQVRVIVAREIGLVSERQATLLLGIENFDKQDYEIRDLERELKRAVDILYKAEKAGLLHGKSCDSELEGLLNMHAIDRLEIKLREMEGMAELKAGLDFTKKSTAKLKI